MITYQYKINMTPGGIPVRCRLGQYDDDWSIVFTLFSASGEFTVESGTTAKIRGTKKDGLGYSANATINISNKTVTVAGDKQITAVAGENIFELVLYKGTKELSTANIVFFVEPAAMDAGTLVSDSQVQEILDMSADVIAASANVSTLRGNFAPAYSSSAPYAVGDYCVRNNQLYRCKTAISTGEQWTAGHWTAVNVTEEVCDLKSGLISTIITLSISQGYYAVASGAKADSTTWCRSGYVNRYYDLSIGNSMKMVLLAYDQDGNYVGAWTGSGWGTSINSGYYKSSINVWEISKIYKHFAFYIDFYNGGETITPQDVESALTIVDVREKKIEWLPVSIFDTAIEIEQGYYSVSDGTKTADSGWCRSVDCVNNFLLKTDSSVQMVLVAFASNGTYVGAWNGSTFVDVYSASLRTNYINVGKVGESNSGYMFFVNFFGVNSDITPNDVKSALQIFSPVLLDALTEINSTGELAYLPIKNGEIFDVYTPGGETLPSTATIRLYDAAGAYLNYYGMGNRQSRTITSALDFYYISAHYTQGINLKIRKHEPFGEECISKVLSAIGSQRGDINDIKQNIGTYKESINEAKAIIAKYGESGDPTVCDTHFMWITDIHEEVDRTAHLAEIVSEIGSTTIPFVLNTGDTVKRLLSDGVTWYNSVVSSMSVPVLNMVGNHDAYAAIRVLVSDKKDVYNEIISPFVSSWGVVSPTGAAENGYCYYYKELSSDIRLIVLDCMYWDATQKAWFDSILSDSITNSKQIIVAVHAPFASSYCTMVDSVWNTGWLSRDSTVTNIEAMESVQSFINNGGVFIAWLQGHVHGDEIVTLDNGRQLAICNNSFSNRGTKVPKISDTNAYNYNSYTVVAVDASLHYLKLYRIGANVSVSGRKHNGFVWDYDNRTVVADW